MVLRNQRFMENTMKDIMPPVEELLEMEPEEIGPFVLEYLNRQEETGSSGQLNRYNFTLETNTDLREYAEGRIHDVVKVLMEGWRWLEREGFIAPKPGEQGEWVFITRKGKKLRTLSDFEAFRQGNLLPASNLDPILARKVRPLFVRGDYDTSIFQAFKEVEIRIRKLTGFSDDMVGVDLARKAFDPETGPLSDKSVVMAERKAISHLFAGALGAFKNSTSHRDMDLNNPAEVAELIFFANYLLRVVESRGNHK